MAFLEGIESIIPKAAAFCGQTITLAINTLSKRTICFGNQIPIKFVATETHQAQN